MQQPKPLPVQSSISAFFKPHSCATSTIPLSQSTNSTIQSNGPPPTALISPLTGQVHSTPPVQKKATPSSLSLPPQATISTIHEKHVQPLKRINCLLLPINYPDSFYRQITNPATSPNFSRVILWQDAPTTEAKVVGGIVCRLDHDEVTRTSAIYIQSLVLLSPYRTYGLATAALNAVISSAVSAPLNKLPIIFLYAHVWTDNVDALEWYSKRDFLNQEPIIHGYYRKLTPDTAFILRRKLSPSDHLRQVSGGTAPPLPIGVPSKMRPQHDTLQRAASYQNKGPETEWNDLPEDILQPSRSNTPLVRSSPFGSTTSLALTPDKTNPSGISSSRVASGGAGKKKRQYPAAAFEPPGSQ